MALLAIACAAHFVFCVLVGPLVIGTGICKGTGCGIVFDTGCGIVFGAMNDLRTGIIMSRTEVALGCSASSGLPGAIDASLRTRLLHSDIKTCFLAWQ